MTAERLIFCMKWGTRYGAEYVNRLYRACARHAHGPFRLVCFTEDARGIGPEVDTRPLPPFMDLEPYASRPWRKLSLWQAELGADLAGREALVLDLDLVITGALDDFWTYQPDRYAVIDNWTKPGANIGNTSVFRMKVGAHPEIYDQFMRDPHGIAAAHGIEQEFISSHLIKEQVFWPRAWCRSFKEELLPAWPLRYWQPAPLPADCRIAVFHGKPDPDEAQVGRWPAPWWRLDKRLRPVPWIAEHWR